MEILYLLVPLSALLVLLIVALFGWAVFRGQFDDLEDQGRRILDDDQPGAGTVPEEFNGGRSPSAS